MKEDWLNYKFIYLQEWQGFVEEVGKNYFLARLIDITSGGTDEKAKIPFSAIKEEDMDYIKEGAIFFWDTGNLIKDGKKIPMSIISFYKKEFTKEDLEKAEKRAKELFETFKLRRLKGN